MKNSKIILVFIFIIKITFADLAQDLTTGVINNDPEEIISVIDNATSNLVSLSNMLQAAQTALQNTTASNLNNVARQYLHDFYYRPYIDSPASNVIYVDNSLFNLDQIGVNQLVLTSSDRIIFKTIQSALDYIANSQAVTWTVVINQGFYDENLSIPPYKKVTLTGVGGVVIGNGLGDQFSSSPVSSAKTVTWNAADNSLNNCFLKIQCTAYGCDTYRNMSYSRFMIGNFFTTNIVSPITTPPTLEFDSVYPWGAMGSSSTDIGNINMILRNVRMGGSLNFTSANIQDIDTVLIVPSVSCRSLGTVIHNIFYDSWTVQDQFSNTLLDSSFGTANNFFTLMSPPYQLNINSSSYYWWNRKNWITGGTIVPQPLQ